MSSPSSLLLLLLLSSAAARHPSRGMLEIAKNENENELGIRGYRDTVRVSYSLQSIVSLLVFLSNFPNVYMEVLVRHPPTYSSQVCKPLAEGTGDDVLTSTTPRYRPKCAPLGVSKALQSTQLLLNFCSRLEVGETAHDRKIRRVL